MNNPKISVVFTSYNHKEYLRQALDNLLSQSFKDFELIIVDDFSTDGSQEILKEYSTIDSRIELHLNDRNHGNYTYTTNQGASYAKGYYIVFSQCDDFARYDQLEKLYSAAIANHDVGLIFSASQMVDEHGECIGSDFYVRSRRFKKICRKSNIIAANDFQTLIQEACVIPNLSALMIKRSLFEQLNGLNTDFYVLSDWDFYNRASQLTDVLYLREELNNFRQHKTTIRSSVKIVTQVTEIIKMKIEVRRFQKDTLNTKDMLSIGVFWIGFLKSGPKTWIKSAKEVLCTCSRFDKRLPYIMLLSLFIHPYKVLKFRFFGL